MRLQPPCLLFQISSVTISIDVDLLSANTSRHEQIDFGTRDNEEFPYFTPKVDLGGCERRLSHFQIFSIIFN